MDRTLRRRSNYRSTLDETVDILGLAEVGLDGERAPAERFDLFDRLADRSGQREVLRRSRGSCGAKCAGYVRARWWAIRAEG